MLKLVHANSASRLIIISAKWISGNLILGLTILLGLIIGLLYLFSLKRIVLNSEELTRMFAIFSLAIFYVLFFFQAALLASCACRSSQMAIMSMLILWTTLIFITPNFCVLAGKHISPVPPLDFLARELHEIDDKYDEKEKFAKSREEWDAIQDEMYQADWNMKKYVLDRMKRQRQTTVLLSIISPAPTFAFAAAYLAGTSVKDYEAFMNRARLESARYANWRKNFRPDWPLEKRKRYSLQRDETAYQATFDSNRVNLFSGFRLVFPYIAWLVILNSFLFISIVIYYDRKTKIL
jgi:ABC-type transport system involved in multi-copper enzyme maturation permease subunit